MLTHGISSAMRGNMTGLGRLWRIHRVSDGEDSGMAALASRINSNWVTMAGALKQRSMPFELGGRDRASR
jgi:hypothetical protein